MNLKQQQSNKKHVVGGKDGAINRHCHFFITLEKRFGFEGTRGRGAEKKGSIMKITKQIERGNECFKEVREKNRGGRDIFQRSF